MKRFLLILILAGLCLADTTSTNFTLRTNLKNYLPQTASIPVLGDLDMNSYDIENIGSIDVNDANITELLNLTTDGFIKTSGGTGTLIIDANTFLTTADAADFLTAEDINDFLTLEDVNDFLTASDVNTTYVPYSGATDDVNLGSHNFVTTGTFDAGAVTGTSFVIGANTLDTAEWAFLDGQNQAVKTTDSPTFANETITGKITTYNNIATEGYGVPAIVDVTILTDQHAAIGATALSNTNVAGLYRGNYYIVCTTSEAGTGTCVGKFSYTDAGGATSVAWASIAQTSINRKYATVFMQVANTDGITFEVADATPGTTARFAVYVLVERLN